MTEWFDIVSPEGTPVGCATRALCHRCPALLHRVVHVIVYNTRGELYLQKRAAAKDIQPGKWDTSVGGHVNPGESIQAAARREVREELGINPPALVFLYAYVWTSECERELVSTFSCRYDGSCCPDPAEIEQGRWWSPADIKAAFSANPFTPNFIEEYRRWSAHEPCVITPDMHV